MTTTSKIMEACATSAGMARAELAAAIDKSRQITGSTLDYLVNTGRIYKSGVHRHIRYFTNADDAQAWSLVAQDAYDAARQTAKGKRLADKAARERARNKAKRPYRPRAQTQPKKQHPAPIQSAQPTPRAEPAAPAVPVTVIWPDHVKVQKAPTPKDMRFTFEPTPGWRGAITSDWMNRRLEGTNNA
jgi:hypothetical protein